MVSKGVNINAIRRSREEALRRRTYRNRAARLDGVRPQFHQWMRDEGFSEVQQRAELARLQEHVELNEFMAEEGDVD